jgi:hypothetical protein
MHDIRDPPVCPRIMAGFDDQSAASPRGTTTTVEQLAGIHVQVVGAERC